jgi:hypothetical protein
VSLDSLTALLAAAKYDAHVGDVRLPPDLFSAMSTKARAFVRIITDTFDAGYYSPYQFLKDEWTDEDRVYFATLPPDVQLEVLGFLTGLLHEYTHHVDLTATPFGANFHGKMAREYLGFQRHWPELVNADPPLLDTDTTLADWLTKHPAGPETVNKLLAEGPLGLAEVELRGPMAFEDVMRGVPPRRIEKGWPGEGKKVVSLRGRHYEKIIVNQIWATVNPAAEGIRYVGPREILEGRALALCLSYLSHLLGDSGGAQSALLRYVQHYYDEAPHYKVAVAIISGKSLEQLCEEGEASLSRTLRETIAATWYALQSPQPVAGDDLLMALPARFLMACRALQDNDLMKLSTGVSFLDSLDRALAKPLSYKPVEQLLKQSIWGLQVALDEIEECVNSTLREWFERSSKPSSLFIRRGSDLDMERYMECRRMEMSLWVLMRPAVMQSLGSTNRLPR